MPPPPSSRSDHSLIVCMGVSGSGKSSVGRRLAEMKGATFLEADDFHSHANIEKMKSGTPLTDDDRAPWISTIIHHIEGQCEGPVVLACSALTRFVQSRLATMEGRDIRWVLLCPPRDVISQRMQERDHFMPPALLSSQYDALEPPAEALTISDILPIDALADKIANQLK